MEGVKDEFNPVMALGFKFQLKSRTKGFRFIVSLNAFTTYGAPRPAADDFKVRTVHRRRHCGGSVLYRKFP